MGDIAIRWLIRKDMPRVMEIELACFEFAWTEEDFLMALRQRNCIGMVACDANNTIHGFMIYELHKDKLRILNLGVHPDSRLSGVGRTMMKKVQDKLSQQRRKKVVLEVRETNLDAQRFFRSCGFRATEVVEGYYEAPSEDAYLMEYKLGDPTTSMVNRITPFMQ